MASQQRLVIIIALSLILISSLAGAFFAFSVEQETLLKLREQYETAFVSAAGNDLQTASASLQHAEKLNYRYVRIIDAHTHIIKLATLLLLISLLLPLLNWACKIQLRFAMTLATGCVLFPASIFLQIYVSGLVFKAGAAIGALLIIACMSVLVLSLFKKTDSHTE